MKIQAFLLASSAALLLAQGPPPAPPRTAPVTDVPFSRLQQSDKEPQNWLMFSGNLAAQHHSQLKQITPDNAKNLELKWVTQFRSLDKHEATPLVIDGVMYAIQSPNDVIAINAETGKALWSYSHKPAAGTKNPC